jgi:hypothetical protein
MSTLTSVGPPETPSDDVYGFGPLGPPEPGARVGRLPIALPGEEPNVYNFAVCHRPAPKSHRTRIVPDDLPMVAGLDWGEVPEDLDLSDTNAVLAHVCGT